MSDDKRTRYGVTLKGDVWVKGPDGDYKVIVPPHMKRQGGFGESDLIIAEKPCLLSAIDDGELRWMAMDALCDAFGVM